MLSIAFYLTHTNWGEIASVISAIILIGYLIRSGRRNHLIGRIELTYIIPQHNYPNDVHFEGAPKEQQTRKSLTIGIGKYRIMGELTPKVTMQIEKLRLHFEGSEINKPTEHGYSNPFITGTRSGEYVDWWGNTQRPVSYPQYAYPKHILSFGYKIETTGKWKGKLCFEIPIVNERIISRALDLEVTDDATKDQIPFLKDWG